MKLNLMAKLTKHAPLLCAIAATGMVFGAVVSAIHDTPKALQRIDEERTFRAERKLEPLSKWEMVKIAVPCYIPTIATTIAAETCIILSVVTGQKKYAALAAASSLTEAAFRNFKDSAKEALAPEEYKKVTERVADKTVERRHAAIQNEVDIVTTGHGDTLCIEHWSGKVFRARKEWVEHCINVVNEQMRCENWVTLADLLDEIGVFNAGHSCSVLGWEINSDGYIEPAFSSRLIDGEPALVIDYVNGPRNMQLLI